MTAQPQPDPYSLFLAAVKKATSSIGENMEGFVMSFSAKRINHPDGDSFPGVPDEQLVFTQAAGGSQNVVNHTYLEMAVNLLEQFLLSNRGNLYVASEVMKSRILEKFMQRERQRNP
jgi:hypothetical protein